MQRENLNERSNFWFQFIEIVEIGQCVRVLSKKGKKKNKAQKETQWCVWKIWFENKIMATMTTRSYHYKCKRITRRSSLYKMLEGRRRR